MEDYNFSKLDIIFNYMSKGEYSYLNIQNLRVSGQ